MNDKIISFCEILNNVGVTEPDELIKFMLRTYKTYKYMNENNISYDDQYNSDDIFNIMKKYVEPELGYFQGDRSLFYNLFKVGQDIDIVEFTNYIELTT